MLGWLHGDYTRESRLGIIRIHDLATPFWKPAFVSWSGTNQSGIQWSTHWGLTMVNPQMGVSPNHPFLGIFPCKPSSYGGTPIYGKPQLENNGEQKITHPMPDSWNLDTGHKTGHPKKSFAVKRTHRIFRRELSEKHQSIDQPHDGSMLMVDWCDNMNGVFVDGKWQTIFLAYIRIL